MRYGIWVIPVLLALASCGIRTIEPQAGTETWHFTVDGLDRTALVHPPADKEDTLSVLFCFHGGYGTAGGMERSCRLSDLADREGFIAVYPQGRDRHWKDGRFNPDDLSDVLFITVLIDSVESRFNTDIHGLYAIGMSNGGMFCHFLASKLPGVFAGIAPVCAGVGDPGFRWFEPGAPTDVCIIQGRDDPLVPYEGGGVGLRGGRGQVLSTEETVSIWRRVNGCTESPELIRIPDSVIEDGCSATGYLYHGVRDLLLIDIEGGGHVWPGGERYLTEGIEGSLCEDFDAGETAWRFFQESAQRKNQLNSSNGGE